ncbi:hypothetical protein [Rheinheimera soli]|uniref:Uncharacterized protein n=1 Tax=Rheinheimera soli TaxID=443616 RepID=A0ABU1VZ01_9GAMM|nr:hypothetical protein [Rheinheimera soli]MDR7120928.1 hypothetical protein [Rheinheimera soli]
MKYFVILVSCIIIFSLWPSWSDGPYEVYWIDGKKSLGYSLGDGAYIRRIENPREIQVNEKYISLYACPEDSCGFYYIDKSKDHQYAEAAEFVFGPYTKSKFMELQQTMLLPMLKID